MTMKIDLTRNKTLCFQTDGERPVTEQQQNEIISSSLNERSNAVNLSGKLSASIVLSGSLEMFHSIWKMTDMTELDLSNNSLSSLPSATGNLVCLRRLVLDGNQLQTLPAELSQCLSITELSLQKNKFHEIPRVVMDLNKIVELDIRSFSPLHLSMAFFLLLFSFIFQCQQIECFATRDISTC